MAQRDPLVLQALQAQRARLVVLELLAKAHSPAPQLGTHSQLLAGQ